MSLPSLVNLKQGVLFQPTGSKTFYVALYNNNDTLEWFRGNNNVLEFLKNNKIMLTKYEDYVRDNLEEYYEEEEYYDEDEYDGEVNEEEYYEEDEYEEEFEEDYDDEFIDNDISSYVNDTSTIKGKKTTPVIVEKSKKSKKNTQRHQKPVQKHSNIAQKDSHVISKPVKVTRRTKSIDFGQVDEEIYFKLFIKKPREWNDMNDVRMRLSHLTEKQKRKMKEANSRK